MNYRGIRVGLNYIGISRNRARLTYIRIRVGSNYIKVSKLRELRLNIIEISYKAA